MAKRKTNYAITTSGTYPHLENTLRRLVAGEELRFLNHTTGYEFPNGDRVEYKAVIQLKSQGNICDTPLGVAYTTPEKEKEKQQQRDQAAHNRKQTRLNQWTHMIHMAIAIDNGNGDKELQEVLELIAKEAMSLASLSD